MSLHITDSQCDSFFASISSLLPNFAAVKPIKFK